MKKSVRRKSSLALLSVREASNSTMSTNPDQSAPALAAARRYPDARAVPSL
jgi:hypothetical protein